MERPEDSPQEMWNLISIMVKAEGDGSGKLVIICGGFQPEGEEKFGDRKPED